ncbi:MAG: hypothetical protein GY847_20345 [Proteobacteria bacterium]|nr:hypothetical protein [Pseudomonadota bacterium]
MTRVLFEPLPSTAFMFRLAETGKHFLPEKDPPLLPDSFRPSSQDEKEGEENNRPPGVSVWDRELTTLAEAKRIRFMPKQPPKGVRAFGLTVASIREKGQAWDTHLDVVAAPYPASIGPGAAGHSHIEGLMRQPGKEKRVIRELRLALVDEALKNEVF